MLPASDLLRQISLQGVVRDKHLNKLWIERSNQWSLISETSFIDIMHLRHSRVLLSSDCLMQWPENSGINGLTIAVIVSSGHTRWPPVNA